jgi:hypothetical protein
MGMAGQRRCGKDRNARAGASLSVEGGKLATLHSLPM